MDTRRSVSGLVVVFAMVLLAISAQPVAAANVGIASENTNATDFNNATTLDDFSVVGSGDSAVVEYKKTSDAYGFEDGTFQGWGTDVVSPTSVTVDGSSFSGAYGVHASETAGSDGGSVTITSPKSDYSPGFRMTAMVQDDTSGDEAHLNIFQFGQGYAIQYGNPGGSDSPTLQLVDPDSNVVASKNVEPPQSSWFRIILSVDKDGNMEFRSEQPDGTTIHTLSHTFSTPPQTGDVGLGWNTGSAQTGNWYADDIEIEPTSGGGGQYVGQAHDVEQADSGVVNFTEISNATANVEWQYYDGTAWQTYTTDSYSTAGEKTVSLDASRTKWRADVTVQDSDVDGIVRIANEGVTFTNSDPSVDNTTLTPEGTLDGSNPTFTVNVSDPDFSLAQGDTINASLYVDGSKVGYDTVTSNGEASVTAQVTGDSEYYWSLSDAYGGTAQSETVSIRTPSKLLVFNETAPYNQITGTEVDITATGSSGETTDLFTTTDGSVVLAGLPPDENYIMTIDAGGYYPKEIYVEDLYSQQNAYLLPKDVPAISNRVTVSDRTGRFGDDTILIVDRVIDTDLQSKTPDTGTEWVIVGGDRLGQSGFYSAELEQYGRYRFRVRNADGDTRVLGEYTAKSDGLVELEIGSITYAFGDNDGYEWDASLQDVSGGNYSATFAYNDYENLTSEVSVSFRYRDSGKLIAQETFTGGPYGEVVYTVPINESVYQNESFVVEWNATRDGEIINGQRLVGGTADQNLPLDPMWIAVGFGGLILSLAFLVGAGAGAGPALVTVALTGAFAVFTGLAPAALGMGAVLVVLMMGGAYTMQNARGV